MLITDLFFKATSLAKSALKTWQLFVCLLAISIGLFFLEKNLSKQGDEAYIALLNAQKDDISKYQQANVGQIRQVLSSLASYKVAGLWIEEISYTDKKCTFDIKMRSLLVNDIYLYVSAFMYSKTFKDSGASIGYSRIIKKGYKTTVPTDDNSALGDDNKPAQVPFILAYLKQQQQEREQQYAQRNADQDNHPDKSYQEWNYEFNIKVSLCD